MCVCDDISVCRRRVCVCHDLNCFFDYTSRLIMNMPITMKTHTQTNADCLCLSYEVMDVSYNYLVLHYYTSYYSPLSPMTS